MHLNLLNGGTTHLKFLSIASLAFILCTCSGDSSFNLPDSFNPDEAADEGPPNTELEILTYEEGANGETVLRVQPNIHSKADLMAYRAQKIAEIEEILESTDKRSAEKPYYPAIITMSKPVSLADLRKILKKYNPTVAQALKSTSEPVKYLPKVQLAKNQDALIINYVKFISSRGSGRLSYETLSDEKQLSKLEKQIAQKEKELNGIDNYQLIKGVTSISGGIHRDSILPMQDDPRVFLTDIGPADMYEGNVDGVLWRNIYNQVELYLNQP